MRVAWFIARGRENADPIDDTASLLAELGSRHVIELYVARRAHDFVWQQFRQPFDVGVYDLTDAVDAAFIWPYLLHYPGIVRLRSGSLEASRSRSLRQQRRGADNAAELAFGRRGRLRIPLTASRLAVVGDEHAARLLQEEYPDARVRHAPIGVPGRRDVPPPADAIPTFGVIGTTELELVQRAVERAREAGASLSVRFGVQNADEAAACDAIIALAWPPAPEPPAGALVAFAAGRPAMVYEVAATGGWPALDPQTWQPRGLLPEAPPIAVSIDPRDAEQSLMHALRRLAGDRELRARMGPAARAWVDAHATVDMAARVWERHLAEAATLAPPVLPPDWPPHLTADGSASAREVLGEMGVSVDVLG